MSRYLLLGVIVPVLAAFSLCPAASLAQGPPFAKHWQISLDRGVPGLGPSEDWATNVIQSSDGGYVAAGFTQIECPATKQFQRSPHLIKVDPQGEILWERPIDMGLPCDYGQFQEVIETKDAYVAVALQKVTPQPGLSPNRIAFVKVRKDTGEILRQRLFHTSPNFQSVTEESTPRGIREIPGTGEFAVVGKHRVSPGPSKAFFLRLSAEGALLSQRSYDLDGKDGTHFAIDTVAENGVFAGFILGGSNGAGGDSNALLRRVNASGDVLWALELRSREPGSGLLDFRHWIDPAPPGQFSTLPLAKAPGAATQGPCNFPTNSGRDIITSVQSLEDGKILVGAHFNEIQSAGNASQCGPGSPFVPEYRAGEGAMLEIDAQGNPVFAVNPEYCSGLDFQVQAKETRGPEGKGYLFSCTVAGHSVEDFAHDTEALLLKTDLFGNELYRRQFVGVGNGACIFDMAATTDGGAILVGNNTAGNDDSILNRLYSGCQSEVEYSTVGDLYVQESIDWGLESFHGSLTIESGHTLTIASDSRFRGPVRVEAGARLHITDGAVVQFADTRQLNDFDEATNAERTELVVEPGGRLDLSGGAKLRGIKACDGMWEGVQVVGDPSQRQLPAHQGWLFVTGGAVIQDALVGARADRSILDERGYPVASLEHTGGVIRVRGGRFLNNRVGAEILPYTDPVAAHFNLTVFNNASFEASDVLLDSNFVDETGRRQSVWRHLSLQGVRNVRVFGSDFIHSAGLDEDLRGRGISARNASFTVSSRCLDPVTDFTPGCQNPDPSSFQNLSEGIASESNLTTRRMTVSGSEFTNVQRGITSTGQSFDSIRGNVFDIPAGFAGPTYGAKLTAGEGFLIEDNSFTTGLSLDNTALVLDDSGLLPSRILGNEIDGLNTGFRFLGDHPELEVHCNGFTSTLAGALVIGGTLKAQGSCAPGEFAADNRFLSAAGPHILAHPGSGFVYRYPGNGPGAAEAMPVASSSVTLELCSGQALTCPRPDPCPNPFDCPLEPNLLVGLAQQGRYSRIARVLESSWQPGADLWLTRFSLENGDQEGARAAWSRLDRSHPGVRGIFEAGFGAPLLRALGEASGELQE